MANVKITELPELAEAPASGDLFEVVDVSTGLNKKVQAQYIGGGGAVSSVNGQTGAVSIDLESVLTEGNTATDLSIILNDNLTNNLSIFAQGIDIYGTTNKATLIAEASVSLADSVSGDESNLTNDTLVISNTTENQKVKVFKNKISREKGGFQTDLEFTDPTANRVITFKDESGTVAYLSDIPTVDSTPTDGSANAVSSNGVFDALAERIKIIKKETTPFSYSGTITETEVYQFMIPANTLSENDTLHFSDIVILKSGSGGAGTYRLRTATTNVMPSGALGHIATMVCTANAQTYSNMKRTFIVTNGVLKGYGVANATTIDNIATISTPLSTTFDPEVDNYFFVSAQAAVITQTMTFNGLRCTN